MLNEQIKYWNEHFNKNNPVEVIKYFTDLYQGRIALGSSLGAEDQVLTDMIVNIDSSIRIFTLDTGRLFPETYQLIADTELKYGIKIEIFFPKASQVEEMVNKKGINLFYKSIENRKECCHIRKIEPLRRALSNVDIWICGLRKDQSITRFTSKLVEWDESNQLIKLNPLVDWDERKVWDYIHTRNIPYNALHDSGFASIGCQPCTRAIEKGEDIRAGRWWWEQPEQKECGLHNKPLHTTIQ